MLLSTLSKCTADLHALAIPHDLLRRNQRMTDHSARAETARKGCNPIHHAEMPIFFRLIAGFTVAAAS
jgi:hypothetical protein